jgi:hypothetical protein
MFEVNWEPAQEGLFQCKWRCRIHFIRCLNQNPATARTM